MRNSVPAILLVGALLASHRAEAQDDDIEVGERAPLSFVLSSPTGASARTRTSDLIRLIDEATHQRTGLQIQSIDESVTKGCRGRLVCIVLRIRTDYEREALKESAGRYRPYDDHLAILRARNALYPKLLLFVTNITREGEPDRLSAQLIDTDRALDKYHSAPRDGEDWEANVEAAINEAALSTPRTEVHDVAGAESFVQALFREHLRASFETAGVWEPFGSIDLTIAIPDLSLGLDGVSIGVTQKSGVTRLRGVKPGKRHLTIGGVAINPFEANIDVQRGETTVFEPELAAKSTGGSRAARNVTLIAGGAAIIVGGIVTGLALATPEAGASGVCFRGVQANCETGRELVRSSYDPTRFNDQNGGGILLAPLGYSLVAAGATWGIGTWFFTDDGEVPWIPLAIGLGVGVLSYSVSALINPSLYSGAP